MDELEVHKGLDCDQNVEGERLLVGANNLAWCFDVDPNTIRRWAATGIMPKPLRIGSSQRWNVTEVRAWIEDGCPPVASPEVTDG